MYKTIRLGKTVCLSISMLTAAAAVIVPDIVKHYSVEAADAGTAGTELPIIMYHSVVKDPSLRGEYVITAEELESDLIWLRDNGYTTILCRDLPEVAAGNAELPEKPVVLTFDDGSYNNFYYVLPLLEKYDVCAVFAPVGEWTETAAEEESPSTVYSYMDIENLRSCALSGRVELADHTYSLHGLGERRGALPKEGEDESVYRQVLWSDLDRSRRLIEKAAGEMPKTLAYPYGFANELTEELTEQLGYEVTLGCEERVNIIMKDDSGCLRKMGRFNREAGRTVEEIIKAEQGAK